jgi:signal transduction histidine kinase
MTPWHQMAIQENRPLLINQNDPETFMSDNEAGALVFEKMQSALIVPIVVNGITYGLITLGEMRNWDRFSYKPATITFCKEIAARIGDAVKIFSLSRVILNSKSGSRGDGSVKSFNADIRRELKSPLTNIRGSLDLLKLRGIGETDGAGKIIDTLEQSTNRMISLLDNEMEKVPV